MYKQSICWENDFQMILELHLRNCTLETRQKNKTKLKHNQSKNIAKKVTFQYSASSPES